MHRTVYSLLLAAFGVAGCSYGASSEQVKANSEQVKALSTDTAFQITVPGATAGQILAIGGGDSPLGGPAQASRDWHLASGEALALRGAFLDAISAERAVGAAFMSLNCTKNWIARGTKPTADGVQREIYVSVDATKLTVQLVGDRADIAASRSSANRTDTTAGSLGAGKPTVTVDPSCDDEVRRAAGIT